MFGATVSRFTLSACTTGWRPSAACVQVQITAALAVGATYQLVLPATYVHTPKAVTYHEPTVM